MYKLWSKKKREQRYQKYENMLNETKKSTAIKTDISSEESGKGATYFVCMEIIL